MAESQQVIRDLVLACESATSKTGQIKNSQHTLFARHDSVELAWHIVDPILGMKTQVHEYEPATWGPMEANAMIADVGGWHSPKQES